MCPKTSHRLVIHKDINNVKACLKLLDACGENIHRFVSHYVDLLPPVGFGHMDTSALLGRMELLNQEVAGLRRALETQATVSEGLGAVTATMERRISDMERRIPAGLNGSGLPPPTPREMTADPVSTRLPHQEMRLVSEDPQPSILPVPAPTQPRTPQWSTVVRNGRKKSTPRNAVQSKPSFKQPRPKRESKPGITGTSTGSQIQVVTTKRVSVFATRFHPDLEADTLRDYLVQKLNNDTVTCRKIDSANSRYGSFHVTSLCANIDIMYDPELWPSGTYIRRYYEARVKNTASSETITHENTGKNTAGNSTVTHGNADADRGNGSVANRL